MRWKGKYSMEAGKNSTVGLGVEKNFKYYLLHFGVYIVFLLVALYFAVGNSNFLSVPNILLILQQATPLAIAATGMTLVLILAGVDISAGQNMYLSAVVMGMVMQKLMKNGMTLTTWGTPFLIMGIGLCVGLCIGFINGLLIGKFNMVPFIATLATLCITRGVTLLINNSATVFVTELSPYINLQVFSIPMIIIFAIVIMVIFDMILRIFPYGRRLFATGKDNVAATRIGISVVRMKFTAYLICGGLVGICGAILGAQIGGIPVTFAMGNEFVVISACVLGGTSLFGGKGSIIPGAMFGMILVQMIMNGLTMVNASPYIYQIVRALIIFLVVGVDCIGYKGEIR